MGNREWIQTRLGDLVEIKHGWAFKSEHFHAELTGRPIVISVGNFRYTGGFRFAETATKEYRGSYPREYELAPGDMLLVMTCQTAGGEILGIPARVPDDDRVYLHNQRLGRVGIRDRKRIDPDFLYWLFLWNEFNRELVTSATGTKILHTAPSRIEAFTFGLPPLPEQRAVAHTLSALDDKIELNRQLNERLEAMARALFKSWFVDFDPVHAKAQGRDPGLPTSLGDLFPAGLVDSELGSTPRGWKVARFGDVVEQARDQEHPLESPKADFLHFSIPAFDEGMVPRSEVGESIKSVKSRVIPGSILLSKLNPEIERVWLVDVDPGDRAICSTEFLVLPPRAGFGRFYAYCLARSPILRQQIEALVTGTSKSHQRAHADAILDLPIVLPPEPVAAAFEDATSPLLTRALRLRRESRILAALRDSLLPMLVSGDLRIEHTERFLTDATA